MKVTLGLLVVVALLGATGGARIRSEYPELDIQRNDDDMDGPPPYDDDAMDGPPPYGDDEMNGPPPYGDDEMNGPPPYGDDAIDGPPPYGFDDLNIKEEFVDMDTFNMSIFPREEDIDESLFVSEKDANLTGRCAATFQMPSRPKHHGPCGASYFYVKIGCHRLYPAVCHTSRGAVPGFYHRSHCYFDYANRFYRVCGWEWVGVVHGRAYLYHGKYHTCGVFGGYQTHSLRPLYLCAARYRGWLIPGKLHRIYNRCYFLNRSTTNYYSIIAC